MTRTMDQINPAGTNESIPPGVPHPRPLLYTIEVDSSMLSSKVPHVNNVTFVAWIDRVAELAGERFGHSRERLIQLDRMWFVARHEIDYLAEAFAGDHILAATWIHDTRKSSCRRDTFLWRPSDEVKILQARSTWSFIDLSRRRPCRLPDDIVSMLDPLQDRRPPGAVD